MDVPFRVFCMQAQCCSEAFCFCITLSTAKENLLFNGDVDDPNNVAYQKATRSNLNKKDTFKVTDGDLNTTWKGKFFPSYIDIDLMDTYAISDIQLYFPKDKVIYYTVYGSNDGKNYDELYQTRSDKAENCRAR